jgi:hypothetical protein
MYFWNHMANNHVILEACYLEYVILDLQEGQQDTKEVWQLGCGMVLHYVQGRGLCLGEVPGGPCCVPKGRRQP